MYFKIHAPGFEPMIFIIQGTFYSSNTVKLLRLCVIGITHMFVQLEPANDVVNLVAHYANISVQAKTLKQSGLA